MSHRYITASTLKTSDARTKVAKIVRFLCANRGPQSMNTIRLRTKIDIQSANNVNVKLSLQHNEKVLVSGKTFEYKPTISGINNRDDMRQYLQSHPEGVKYDNLKDAYVAAETHLAEWQASGRVITFMNGENRANILFWYFGRLRKNKITLNDIKNNKNEKNEKDDGDEKKISLTNDVEEIDDKDCDKTIFPLIGDSIIATWNDIEIPISKETLLNKLKQSNLLNDNFSRKRTRTKAAMPNMRRSKKRRTNINRMNLTNIHMVQDEATKEKFNQNRDSRKDEGRELPQLPQNE